MMRKSFFFLLGCTASLLASCALQVAPTGGVRDEIPPILLSVEPADGSTRFNASEIVFRFDENLQLKDVNSKLVISPPLKHVPLVKARKEKLVVTLDDTLLPNTTYAFNFGDAVADLNEGNSVKDLTYVISTGDIIDTLVVNGSVVRSENLVPEKSMLVLLHPATADDSAIYRDRPRYFTRTRDDGSFKITNVAPGNYRIYALMDHNDNYVLDDPSERIAFLSQAVEPSNISYELFSFQKELLPALTKASNDGPGKINIIFNRPFPVVNVSLLSDSTALQVCHRFTSMTSDTLVYWYKNMEADTASFLLAFQDRVDTVTVQLMKKQSAMAKKRGFDLDVAVLLDANGVQPPNRPLVVTCNHPVEKVDTAFVKWQVESAMVPVSEGFLSDSSNLKFTFNTPWKEEQRYSLRLYPGALVDVYGMMNDTVSVDFSVASVTDYGTVKVTLSGRSVASASILQLVSVKDDIIRSFTFNGDTAAYYDFIKPASYRVKLIDDVNGNGKWDTGDDLKGVQPEKVRYYNDPVPVRANWDVEVKWDVK